MERDPTVGEDAVRDPGDDASGAWRDAPPERLTPIDESAPVSGHVPPPETRPSIATAPEHTWEVARDLIYPAFRPVGTHGLAIAEIDREMLAAQATLSHAQPLIDDGPAGLPVVYTIDAGAYDIVVNGDHLLSWNVEPADVVEAALGNLAAWSATAPWTDEVSGERRLISSDSGHGWDAARILLPQVVEHLVEELGQGGRILVGIPERHLLTAATLRPGDDEFAALFTDFVVEHSGGADEPIDRRVFEIVDHRLVEFGGA